MGKYYLSTVDSSRVGDFLSINMTPVARAEIEHSLSRGELTYEQMYVFGHASKPVAAFVVSASPIVVPRITSSISKTALLRFAKMLRDLLAESGKLVIIDTNVANVDVAAFVEAGWSLESHDKLYQTDLENGRWEGHKSIAERPSADLLSPEMLVFYSELLKVDRCIGDTGSHDPVEAFEATVSDSHVRLFVIRDQAQILAAATLFPAVTDDVGIYLLGVIPSERGKGIGRRLHAHLLAVAKTHAKLHVGGTRADNVAMHKIYLANGAKMVAEQIQLKV